jgi:hypothetical protein
MILVDSSAKNKWQFLLLAVDNLNDLDARNTQKDIHED